MKYGIYKPKDKKYEGTYLRASPTNPKSDMYFVQVGRIYLDKFIPSGTCKNMTVQDLEDRAYRYSFTRAV